MSFHIIFFCSLHNVCLNLITSDWFGVSPWLENYSFYNNFERICCFTKPNRTSRFPMKLIEHIPKESGMHMSHQMTECDYYLETRTPFSLHEFNVFMCARACVCVFLISFSILKWTHRYKIQLFHCPDMATSKRCEGKIWSNNRDRYKSSVILMVHSKQTTNKF